MGNEYIVSNEDVELDAEYAVFMIPKATCELDIFAKVFIDGEIKTVNRTLSFDEVRKAFQEAENGYIPEDALFTLTEKGKALAEQLLAEEDADAY